MYRKSIYSRFAGLTAVLHLVVHARCTGSLDHCPVSMATLIPSGTYEITGGTHEEQVLFGWGGGGGGIICTAGTHLSLHWALLSGLLLTKHAAIPGLKQSTKPGLWIELLQLGGHNHSSLARGMG